MVVGGKSMQLTRQIGGVPFETQVQVSNGASQTLPALAIIDSNSIQAYSCIVIISGGAINIMMKTTAITGGTGDAQIGQAIILDSPAQIRNFNWIDSDLAIPATLKLMSEGK